MPPVNKTEERDGERFRYFLALKLAQRQRMLTLYQTPRALRTAIDNAMRTEKTK